MLRLYDFLESGNCYKVRLLLTQLQIPFQRIPVDIVERQTRIPEFLSKNPNGRVPLVEWESGQLLWESNAILFYFSQGTDFLPTDPFLQAQVLQWLFFEQYSHEPFIATSRFWHFIGKSVEYADALAQKQAPGYAALQVMETHLSQFPYFVGNQYSIADIGLYAYTHVAHEGGFDLGSFSAIRQWLQRIQDQLHHITIDHIPDFS